MKSKIVFANLPDEQLCLYHQQGDQSASEHLLERYSPMVRSRARALCTKSCECEDLIQEGLIALMNAMKSYDPNGGASFKTLAYVCITNRMLTERKRNHREETALSISDYSAFAQQHEDPFDLLSSRELINDETLSHLEQNAFRLYLDGYTYREMAASLQSTTKAVDNALQRARKKLRV